MQADGTTATGGTHMPRVGELLPCIAWYADSFCRSEGRLRHRAPQLWSRAAAELSFPTVTAPYAQRT